MTFITAIAVKKIIFAFCVSGSIRGVSRTAATSKMERFVIVVNG